MSTSCSTTGMWLLLSGRTAVGRCCRRAVALFEVQSLLRRPLIPATASRCAHPCCWADDRGGRYQGSPRTPLFISRPATAAAPTARSGGNGSMHVDQVDPRPALPWVGHRRRSAVIVAALALAGVLGGGAAVMAGDRGDGKACTAPRVLRVAVAPQLAPVVQDAAAGLPEEGPGNPCSRVEVAATEPADVARALTAQPADGPDVWIPDASLWLDRVRAAGTALPSELPSVATSPAVLAISQDRARAAGWPERHPSSAELVAEATARLALPEPTTDAATAMSLFGLLSATADQPAGRTALVQVLRHAAQVPLTTREELLAATGTGAAAAV